MKHLFLGAIALATLQVASAATVPFDLSFVDRDTDRYQIGDIWGKVPVTMATYSKGDFAFRKGAEGTAFIGSLGGGATAFYLGKWNGKHLAGTNHHVVRSGNCPKLKFNFIDAQPVLVPCSRIIGHWTDIDFALLEITPTADQERALSGKELVFDWDAELRFGEQLITFGYGTARNMFQSNMMVNEDNDCRVYSGANDFRFIPDPDQLNPMDYLTWSFAHGCDISHGDSGSPLIHRSSGKIVGLVWTATTPKTSRVQDRQFLDSLTSSSRAVWTDFSYGVPARKIGEFLTELTRENELEDADRLTVLEFLKSR